MEEWGESRVEKSVEQPMAGLFSEPVAQAAVQAAVQAVAQACADWPRRSPAA